MTSKVDKKRIKEWVSNWQKTLFLNDWLIHIVFPEKDEEGNLAGTTDCSPRYFETTIKFFPILFKEDLETQWRCVAHEMTHVLLSHIQCLAQRQSQGTMVGYDDFKDVLEQTTVRLSNILVSAWPNKYYEI